MTDSDGEQQLALPEAQYDEESEGEQSEHHEDNHNEVREDLLVELM